jgi:hypothetical protein
MISLRVIQVVPVHAADITFHTLPLQSSMHGTHNDHAKKQKINAARHTAKE